MLQHPPPPGGPSVKWPDRHPDRFPTSVHVRYLSGSSPPTYADFILMAFLAWIARVEVEAWARMTQEVGGGVLEDLWMGCLPYMKSPTHLHTLQWFS